MRKRDTEYWIELFRRQEEEHNAHVREIESAHRKEREALLERIQRPEYKPVEPGPKVIHPAPKDTAELAYVGQEVPSYLQVGTPEQTTINDLITGDPRWKNDESDQGGD